jgi:DNA-binding Lrp family transcriptional regulator
MKANEVCKQLGISQFRLKNLRKKGIIKVEKCGVNFEYNLEGFDPKVLVKPDKPEKKEELLEESNDSEVEKSARGYLLKFDKHLKDYIIFLRVTDESGKGYEVKKYILTSKQYKALIAKYKNLMTYISKNVVIKYTSIAE